MKKKIMITAVIIALLTITCSGWALYFHVKNNKHMFILSGNKLANYEDCNKDGCTYDFEKFQNSEIRVYSGNELAINGKKIGLLGIDVPEYGQKCTGQQCSGEKECDCGVQSRQFLEDLVRKGIDCYVFGNYDAICYKKGKSEDRDISINGRMISGGYAVSEKIHRFTTREKTAQRFKHGIWQEEFERPEDYRQRMRDKKEAAERKK